MRFYGEGFVQERERERERQRRGGREESIETNANAELALDRTATPRSCPFS